MAVRLIRAPYRKCVRAYLPSLQAVVQHFRSFSSQDNQAPISYYIEEPDITQVAWPDPALGPLCNVDRRFPMPGNVGVLNDAEVEAHPHFSSQDEELYIDPVVTLPSQPEERHYGVFAHYFTRDLQTKQGELDEMQGFMPEEGTPKASDSLECAAFDCPQILRKDFADLFPDRNTMEGPFTVITLSQHTEHDMSLWSMEVEEERESLLETFMHGAMEICNSLTKNGFWADFIDPGSGKPFKGPHTNSSLFETDERYRKFGFQIEDLGCCKVIRHPVWGTHAFVSCLFTNAPVYHDIISKIVKT